MTLLRRTARGLGVLALVAPLCGGTLVLAAPAYAASGITAPGNGVDYTSDTTVRITASMDKNSGSADLRLQPPGGTPQTVDSASTSLTAGASLSYNFDTATCESFPGSCSGRAEAANGVWTITLVSGGRAIDSSSFTLRIPPRTPSGLSARADGYRAVVLTWQKGVEPDLSGWTLYADGSASSGTIGTDACSGSSCSTTVTYAKDGTGDHSYALVAHRSVAPSSADTVDSPQSSAASATLTSPPPPPPSPTPSSAGSSSSGSGSSGSGSSSSGSGSSSAGGGSGGSSTTSGGSGSSGSAPSSAGGSSGRSGSGSTGSGSSGSGSAIGTSATPVTVAARRDFALSFQTFAPKLGIPKLPPLPAAQPALAPLPDGTYEKTLGYKDVVKTVKVTTPGTAARQVTGAVGRALDSQRFLTFLAGALIMMLGFAHLRRWLGSHDG